LFPQFARQLQLHPLLVLVMRSASR
jgi:hypothetical protein